MSNTINWYINLNKSIHVAVADNYFLIRTHEYF